MFPIWKSSFSVCDKGVLVVPSTLSFFLSVNLLTSLSNMNEILGMQSNIGSKLFHFFTLFIFSPFIFISWRLITLQYCSGFCHTLT